MPNKYYSLWDSQQTKSLPTLCTVVYYQVIPIDRILNFSLQISYLYICAEFWKSTRLGFLEFCKRKSSVALYPSSARPRPNIISTSIIISTVKQGLYFLQSTSVYVYGTAVGSKAPTIFHLNQTIMGKNTAATKSRKFKRYNSIYDL